MTPDKSYNETGITNTQIEVPDSTYEKNGFTYEIQDAIRCIQAGKLESDVVPWKDTLACAKLFDKI